MCRRPVPSKHPHPLQGSRISQSQEAFAAACNSARPAGKEPLCGQAAHVLLREPRESAGRRVGEPFESVSPLTHGNGAQLLEPLTAESSEFVPLDVRAGRDIRAANGVPLVLSISDWDREVVMHDAEISLLVQDSHEERARSRNRPGEIEDNMSSRKRWYCCC